MEQVSQELQRELILALTNLGSRQGEAQPEALPGKWFYPVPEHLPASQPAVTLVLGYRGSGKSTLFRAVFKDEKDGYVVRPAHLTSANARWIPAHPVGSGFPDARGLQAFMRSRPEDSQHAADFWLAYLVRAIAEHVLPAHRQAMDSIVAAPGADPVQVHDAFLRAGQEPLIALDALDRHLRESNAWLVVGYDELDRLGGFDAETMSWAIRGLLGFWAIQYRRWERLRPKIFMRPDLYLRHAELVGPDVTRLATNRIELGWSDRSLLAMLLKRITTADDRFLEYFQRHLRLQNRDELGWEPVLFDAEDARLAIERLIGTYMGANVKKGLSFHWILDHVRDGRGHAVPGALVELFEKAAAIERDTPRQSSPHLLHPTALRLALEDVSRSQIAQAIAKDWPWLHGVKERLSGQGVPFERRALEDLLGKDWDQDWGSQPGLRPPVPDARVLVDYLVELGILRQRPSGAIDAPSLFLYGLGLRRTGGVAIR
jgi:hypothetical protein